MSSSSSRGPQQGVEGQVVAPPPAQWSTISGNQPQCASPAGTARHLSLVPTRRVGVRRHIAVFHSISKIWGNPFRFIRLGALLKRLLSPIAQRLPAGSRSYGNDG